MARAEKQDLPGIEGPGVGKKKIPAVTKAANAYVRVRDERMELTKKEVAAKAVLLHTMQENGVESYELDNDQVVTITHKDNVKVKTLDEAEAPEPGDGKEVATAE
jgi:hypothetical protein